MRRLLVFAALSTILTGIFATVAPADGPVSGNAVPVAYQVEWTLGQAPTVKEFQGGSPPALPQTPTSPDSASACSVLMGVPQKVVYQGSWVVENASVTCTTDVTYVSGTDYLYRGITKGPYLIGSDSEQENTYAANWSVSGACHSSTWAYWADIPSLYVCSAINGCGVYGSFSSNYHYWSC